MSPVDFKKWQCPLSLLLNVAVDVKVPQCRLSILRNSPVTLSNLRVKGPISSLYLIETTCILVMLLLLWVHTISDDTTVFVFLEASSYSVHTV